MYSVVLMAALTAGSASPESWFKCHGYGGCYGGCYGSSCHGGCCGGCYGYSCHGGCWGGCCGGCYGNGCCGGCHGSSWGCWGSSCYGCCGGCCGGYISYGSGCWGSCTGCSGCYGGVIYTTPATPAPVTTSSSSYVVPGVSSYVPATATNYPSDVRANTYAVPASTGYDRQTSVAPAKLMINLPADAKLYVDGQLTSSTTENRVFTTPELQRGLTYFYDLKAEITRDGQTITENKRLIVRSGDNLRTSFAVLEAKLKSNTIITTAGN